MELKIQLSSAKDWISGFRGRSRRESFSREDNEPCLGESSKGKAVISDTEVEELNERLKALEEETELMKEAFFWSLEERKVMMSEIYKQFKSLHFHGLVMEESSCINPLKDWRVGKSLPEILSPDQNPTLITKELGVNALTFQEPAHAKFHHD